ncbi:hypothetical protein AYL99_08954 [Fonsecaea erecta]|uniref:Cohesin loading factor n=1 Tax=Fonsecaea erecta TaxID=1367422 RepID=A0A178ZB14_9EURO|nr:hypothetical protein AYL99_08954 [Fonsecaea erecta]OAP56842.1 hypothetical protein AYL99_08954 [Fonsecaea erecta]
MDPNLPSSFSNPNSHHGQGYFYDPNNTFRQGQHPPQPQGHPQAQPYYQPFNPQPLPQNYSQYYQQQGYNQAYPYQSQVQQFQPSYYQQPVELQPQQFAQSEPNTIGASVLRHAVQPHTVQRRQADPRHYDGDYIRVVIPSRPDHSSPPQTFHGKQTPRAGHQFKSQAQRPQSAHQNFPNHPQQLQHAPQLPKQHLTQRSESSVVSDLPTAPTTPASSSPSSSKKKERQMTSAGGSNTPNMPLEGQSRVLQSVEVNAKPKQPATKARDHRDPTVPLHEPEPDYPSLLCVLADDYLEAARKLPALTEEYYSLISTALGCLESVLANFKLPPLREAQVSLRYAQILYAETENHDEAETILTKAIELCGRHKFIDLKYEMQLLLSRVLYESKPKAALRDIQKLIEDIEAYRHTAWLYIFRFQHAMFSLASSAPGDIHGAVVQLEKIEHLARQNSDSAILAFAATLEALLHLSSPSQDAVTTSQTALAKARALQLSPDVAGNPQLTVLMEFIDLACSVREADIAQSEIKRKIMQDALVEAVSHPNWRGDGLIYIPVSRKAVAGMQLHGNGYVIEKNGKYHIPFSWLGTDETEALGFLFSAESSAYKNGADGAKAERFLDSGLSVLRALGMPSLKAGYREYQRQITSQKITEAGFLLLLVFLQCSKGLWPAANDTLDKAHAISQDLGDALPVNMKYCLLYLRGAVLQGTGDLTAALQVYQSPLFDLNTPQTSPSAGSGTSNRIANSHHADSDVTRNFSILAAMNSALIIYNPAHPQHKRLSSLIKTLIPAVQNCGNRYIRAHFMLLESILSTNTLAEKQLLRQAMDEGKAIGSAQTTALALIYMHDQLYKGTLEKPALKCAKAAGHQARRWGQPMWMHVAAALEAQTLEIFSFPDEARKRQDEADASWERLPKGVKDVGDVEDVEVVVIDD